MAWPSSRVREGEDPRHRPEGAGWVRGVRKAPERCPRPRGDCHPQVPQPRHGDPVPSLLDACGGHQGSRPVLLHRRYGGRQEPAGGGRPLWGNTQFLKFKLDKDAEKALEVFRAGG